jgi:hypothetical protein
MLLARLEHNPLNYGLGQERGSRLRPPLSERINALFLEPVKSGGRRIGLGDKLDAARCGRRVG